MNNKKSNWAEHWAIATVVLFVGLIINVTLQVVFTVFVGTQNSGLAVIITELLALSIITIYIVGAYKDWW